MKTNSLHGKIWKTSYVDSAAKPETKTTPLSYKTCDMRFKILMYICRRKFIVSIATRMSSLANCQPSRISKRSLTKPAIHSNQITNYNCKDILALVSDLCWIANVWRRNSGKKNAYTMNFNECRKHFWINSNRCVSSRRFICLFAFVFIFLDVSFLNTDMELGNSK